MGEEAWPDPDPCRCSQSRGSQYPGRDQCRIGLPPQDTQSSTRNARLWSQETRPHWRSKQMKSTLTAPKWMRAAVINCHFQNGEPICRQLHKMQPGNSTFFAADVWAITLALNYYRHMGPVHHDVVVYSVSMSCLQAVECEDTENPFICHIMNLLWLLSDMGHTCSFLLDTKPLWHWGKWKSGPTSKGDPRPRYRSTG